MENTETVDVEVRGQALTLSAFNRSLRLCARMNYETENLDFIDDLGEGKVYYDLGACEGRFSVYAGSKGLTVFAFEPESQNFETLKANIDNNGLESSLTAFNVGVGARTGEAEMSIGQPWPGGHQKVVQHDKVRQDLDFEFVDQQKIKIVGLDEFIASNGIPTPDAMKIDIDGSEMPFLVGAKQTLSQSSLLKVLFELDEADPNFRLIISALSEAGLEVETKYQVPNEPTLFNYKFVRSA